MSENTSNTTTVKPHFKLWAKKVEANEVTPQHPHKPFPGWVYGVLFVIFDIIVVTALEVGVSSSSTRVQLSSPCLLYTSPSPRDRSASRMPSSA